MSVYIVQSNGDKTPIQEELLVKLAEKGRLKPNTLVEIDGVVREASQLEQLAPIFKRLGVLERPVTKVPPRVASPDAASAPGTPSSSAPTASASKEPSDSADDELEIRALAKRRVDAKYASGSWSRRSAVVMTQLCVIVLIWRVVELETLGLRLEELWTIFLLFATLAALFAYLGAFSARRADALLREEAELRREYAARERDCEKGN